MTEYRIITPQRPAEFRECPDKPAVPVVADGVAGLARYTVTLETRFDDCASRLRGLNEILDELEAGKSNGKQ